MAEHILLEAPLLAVTLLDGLIWRSHKTKARDMNRVRNVSERHHRVENNTITICNQKKVAENMHMNRCVFFLKFRYDHTGDRTS